MDVFVCADIICQEPGALDTNAAATIHDARGIVYTHHDVRLKCLTQQDHHPKEAFQRGYSCKHLADITCGIGYIFPGRAGLMAHRCTLP